MLSDVVAGAIDGDRALQAVAAARLAERAIDDGPATAALFTLDQLTWAEHELDKRRARRGFQWAVRTAMQSRPVALQLLHELQPSQVALPYRFDADFLAGDLLDAQRYVLESCLTPLYRSGRIDARVLVRWVCAALEEPELLSSVDVYVAQNWLAATTAPRATAFRAFLMNVSLLIAHRGGTSCLFDTH